MKTFSKTLPEGSVIGASKEEQIAKENREVDLIPWQIGAEASKLLVEAPEKWGMSNNSFPIWNDVKIFYNQYLDGKYANIKARLKIYTVSDVKTLLMQVLQGNSKLISLKTVPIFRRPSSSRKYRKLDAQLTQENLKIAAEQTAELAELGKNQQ